MAGLGWQGPIRRAVHVDKLDKLFLVLVAGWTLRLGTDLSETRKILGLDLRRGTVFAPNGVVHFLAMDADLLGGVDPESDFVASNIDDCHLDVIPDHDRLVALTGQHQHGVGSFLGKGPARKSSGPHDPATSSGRGAPAGQFHYSPPNAFQMTDDSASRFDSPDPSGLSNVRQNLQNQADFASGTSVWSFSSGCRVVHFFSVRTT